MAAKEIMRLYRERPGAAGPTAELQTAKASAEEVLHPPDEHGALRDPGDSCATPRTTGDLVALPAATLAPHGLAIDPRHGRAGAAGSAAQRTRYRGAAPVALALLAYLGAGVKAISGAPAARRHQHRARHALPARCSCDRTSRPRRNYSLHTTGCAFDIAARYAHARARPRALQFMLDRLQAHDLIAWVREPAAIHVTVVRAGRAARGRPQAVIAQQVADLPARRSPA